MNLSLGHRPNAARWSSALFAATAVLGVACSASAQYQYQLLTADGQPIRYLLDSNDQGDMVGSVPNTSSGLLDGFMLSATGNNSFWSTPSNNVFPTSINNAGTIVGVNIPVPQALPEGFLRTADGTETLYNFPGALGSIPFGINNDDLVSGFQITSEGRKGFVRNLSGTLSRTVEFPGAVETQLFALNDEGLVGGGYFDANGVTSPFLYDVATESFTTLPKPVPDDNFIVTSVNASGDAIVFGQRDASEGYADFSSYVYDASAETFTQLIVPGSLETYGYDLRDDGSVLGYYQNPDGSFGGFRAFVPEPTSLLLLAGLAAVGLTLRRR